MHREATTDGMGTAFSRGTAGLAPHVSLGLLACATVSTARWLGAEWVAQPWLGLPMGLWAVGAVVGGSVLYQRRALGTADRGASRGTGASMALASGAGMGRALARTLKAYCSHPIFSRGESGAFELGPELLTRAETEHAVAQTEPKAAAVPTAPRVGKLDGAPRIGVSGPAELVDAFVERAREEADLEARFEPVAAPVREPEECAKRALAGAVSFNEKGNTTIILPETKGREAAWSDWSQRLALSYPATFPPRVDAARIACGQPRVRAVRESRLIVRMAEATAILAQLEARTGARRSGEWLAQHEQRASRSMKALARALAADWRSVPTGEHAGVAVACRAAARGVSAWLAMHERAVNPTERLTLAEACAAHIGAEPEAHLRLAATRIGAFEDEEAMRSLRRAFELLRTSGELPASDPLAFVLAEMEIGSFNSLSLGRIAAGLAIAWATTPEGSLDYLREDLLDDLRCSGRLVGRDQDHAFLRQVMGEMDRLRSESMPLQSKAA